jgi:hypothetical protein
MLWSALDGVKIAKISKVKESFYFLNMLSVKGNPMKKSKSFESQDGTIYTGNIFDSIDAYYKSLGVHKIGSHVHIENEDVITDIDRADKAIRDNAGKPTTFKASDIGNQIDTFNKHMGGESKMKDLETVEIRKVNRGFIVTVGCEVLVFENPEIMYRAIGKYFNDPEAAKSEYLDIDLRDKDKSDD